MCTYNYGVRIDLHTHSLCSDGTDSPAQLVGKSKAAGLDVLGLTDHDTVRGWDEAAGAAAENSVRLVRGMELTTEYAGVSVHLLGYLFDPDNGAIRSHCARMARERRERAQKIAEKLARDFPFSFSEMAARIPPGVPLGRPHIADELVRLGIVPNRSAAFASLLSPGSKYYVRGYAAYTPEAIEWINSAGGKAVVAHPKAEKRGRVLPDAALFAFAEAGLFGVETDHRDHSARSRRELSELARKAGLLRFGAGDYHGRGKPNRLGEYTTSARVLEELRKNTFLPIAE